jgi:hypothetical protein
LATSVRYYGLLQDSKPTQEYTFYNQDDPSIREEVLDSRLEGSVPRVFGFFSGFCGIILAELQIDPQLESTFNLRLGGYIPY